MKVLAWVVGCLLLVLTGGYAAFHYLAPRAVAQVVSAVLGSKVTLEGISASRGHWHLYQLTVMSPEGARLPKALSIESLAITYPEAVPHLTGTEIHSVVAREVDLYLDIPAGATLTGSNWGRLLETTRHAHERASGPDRERVRGFPHGSPPRQLFIDSLELEEVRVHLKGPVGLEHSLDPIRSVRREQIVVPAAQVDVSQIAATLFAQILTAVLEEEQILEGVGVGLHETMEGDKSPAEVMEGISESLRSLIPTKPQAAAV